MFSQVLPLAALAIVPLLAIGQTSCPAFTPVPQTEIPRLSAQDKIFRFSGGFVAVIHTMAVDTDGSAFAYHPRDLGTSYLCDGLDPYDQTTHTCDSKDKSKGSQCFKQVAIAIQAGWDRLHSGPFCTYGFDAPGVAARGTSNKVWGMSFGTGPIPIQVKGDPAPGFFISSTAFATPGRPAGTQRHYIDADTVPYVVVPGRLVGQGRDFPRAPTPAWAWSPSSGHESAAVVADTQTHFGEGSVALVQALHAGAISPITAPQVLGPAAGQPLPSLPFPYVRTKSGAVRAASGAAGTILFVYFTKAAPLHDLSLDALNHATQHSFAAFGGEPLFKTCLKQLSGGN